MAEGLGKEGGQAGGKKGQMGKEEQIVEDRGGYGGEGVGGDGKQVLQDGCLHQLQPTDHHGVSQCNIIAMKTCS